jgi:hypothetical protein
MYKLVLRRVYTGRKPVGEPVALETRCIELVACASFPYEAAGVFAKQDNYALLKHDGSQQISTQPPPRQVLRLQVSLKMNRMPNQNSTEKGIK